MMTHTPATPGALAVDAEEARAIYMSARLNSGQRMSIPDMINGLNRAVTTVDSFIESMIESAKEGSR